MEAEEVISYQREALLRLLMGLFSVAGTMPDDAAIASLPKPVRSIILRVLLPAESATRRLVQYLSRRLKPEAERKKRAEKRNGKQSDKRRAARVRAPSFWLFDRRKFHPDLSSGQRVARGPGPSIRFFDDPSSRPEPEAEKPSHAEREAEATRRLLRRMQALFRALNDMPAQARRLQRAMSANRTHEVDELLYECHLMAWLDKPPPDG